MQRIKTAKKLPRAVLLALNVLSPRMAIAEQTRGPGVQAEAAMAKPSGSQFRAVSRVRSHGYGVIPVHSTETGGNLLLSLDLQREVRTFYDIDGGGRLVSDNSLLSWGVLYLFKTPNEIFVPIIWPSRLQATGPGAGLGPMDQIILGFYSRAKAPLFDDINGRLTVAYRIRRYPTHRHYLLYLSQELYIGDLWELTASTYGVRLDWHTHDYNWRLYGGYEGDNRDYPGNWQNQPVWLIGTVITGYAGVRHHIDGLLYWSAEIGLQREALQYTNASNNNLLKYQTLYTPWVKVAVETFITAPKSRSPS